MDQGSTFQTSIVLDDAYGNAYDLTNVIVATVSAGGGVGGYGGGSGGNGVAGGGNTER